MLVVFSPGVHTTWNDTTTCVSPTGWKFLLASTVSGWTIVVMKPCESSARRAASQVSFVGRRLEVVRVRARAGADEVFLQLRLGRRRARAERGKHGQGQRESNTGRAAGHDEEANNGHRTASIVVRFDGKPLLHRLTAARAGAAHETGRGRLPMPRKAHAPPAHLLRSISGARPAGRRAVSEHPALRGARQFDHVQ